MLGLNTVRAKLIRAVAHIGGNRIENYISMSKLAHHREFFALSIDERAFVTAITAEVLRDKASLGDHKRNSAVGDKAAANVPRLRESKLGREDQVRDTHFPVNVGALAVGYV